MRGRKRPTDERARAVGIAVVSGGNEAARQTGIPERTIRHWVESPEFAELATRNKEAVATEWWAGIQDIGRSIIEDIRTAPVRDRAVAFGILVEKMLLVRGEATTRSEVTNFRDYNDEERRKLSASLDSLLEGAAGDRAQADSAEVRQ